MDFDVPDAYFSFLVQALLAARNSATVVFAGTFGALAYVVLSIYGPNILSALTVHSL